MNHANTLVERSRENKIRFSGEVWKRKKLIICTRYTLVSLMLGVATTFFVHILSGGSISIKEIASYGITYAAFSFAACITAVTLFLSLPNRDTVIALVTVIDGKTNSTAYYEMIFVPLWAAVTQLTMVLICAINILFGGDLSVAVDNAYFTHHLMSVVSFSIFYYSILELGITIGMFSNVAKIVIKSVEQGD